MDRLKAVLLVGGFGTRLRPLTNDRPKSTVPVLNRPVLEYTLAYLRQYGVEDIILTVNYLPEIIERYFGDGRRYGVNLTYCLEAEPRGTGGAVKNAEDYLDGTFIVMNGDVFTNINLTEMLDFHRRNRAKTTIALTWVDEPSAFGVAETDKEGRVKQFIEKPPPGTAITNWINAGIYVMEPDVLRGIPAGRLYSFEKECFPNLLKTGQPLYGYTYRGYWLDMGTPGHYYSINMDLLNLKAASPLYKNSRNKPVFDKKNVDIHSSAVIKAPVVIGDGCIIGPGVKINGPVVIGRDCRLDAGALIENTVIWDGVTAGANSRLNKCIVISGAAIGENRKFENSVITPSQIVPLALPE